jgi:hypothetical protein
VRTNTDTYANSYSYGATNIHRSSLAHSSSSWNHPNGNPHLEHSMDLNRSSADIRLVG